MEEIESSGERARELVAQLLAFGKDTPEEQDLIDAHNAVEGSAKMLRSTLPTSITLSVKTIGALPKVRADLVQFDQILLNLCINARDAMEARGELNVTVTAVDAKAEQCRSCLASFSGTMLPVSVEDSGSGIQPPVLERIFDPFFTTKAVGKGSGMGLAMVHGIVHRHGGHLLIDSA
jgi:signal transduction histidine kinase